MTRLFGVSLFALALLAASGFQSPKPGQTVYKGVYVDNLAHIVGTPSKEDEFLHWARKHDFNALTLYDLQEVLGDPARKQALSAFILKARSRYGIKEVTAVVSKAATVTGAVDQYNHSQADPRSCFDYTNLELEWWNNACSFREYDATLQAMKKWGDLQNPAVPNEEYIGWFKNPVGEDSLMAAALVRNSERILLHDYQHDMSFSYVQPRLEWIGKAARAQRKVMPVIIIFNAKDVYLGDFFATHPFSDAYQFIQYEFQKAEFPGKANVRLIGYQIYNQSTARLCKP